MDKLKNYNDTRQKIIVKKSAPQILSLLIVAIVSLMDTVLVAKLGESLLSVTLICEPAVNIVNAIFLGIATSGANIISNKIGSNKSREVGGVFFDSTVLGILSWAIMIIFFIPVMILIFSKINICDINVIKEYVVILFITSLSTFISIQFQMLFLSLGMSFISSMIRIITPIIKIIFEPFLMFGLLGAINIGILAIPISSLIGTTTAILTGVVIIFNKKQLKELTSRWREYKYKNLKVIIKLSIPSSANKMLTPIYSAIIMGILGKISQTLMIFYSFSTKLQRIAVMPTSGICQASVPIIGIINGKKDYKELKKTIYVIIASICITSAFFSVMIFIFRHDLVVYVSQQKDTQIQCVEAISIYVWNFILVSLTMLFTNLFQMLLKPKYSLIITIVEYFVLTVPLLLAFALSLGHPFLWISFEIGTSVSIILGFVMLHKYLKSQTQKSCLQ